MGTCLSSAGKRLGAELVQRAQDLFGFGATPEGGPRFGDQQLARQELNSEVCGPLAALLGLPKLDFRVLSEVCGPLAALLSCWDLRYP